MGTGPKNKVSRWQVRAASCRVGYRSCFYRAMPHGEQAEPPLVFMEERKTFDPVAVYGDAPNPDQALT